MAHSADLRKRVLRFVAKGNRKEDAAERYEVPASTVYAWCRTPEKTEPDKPGPKACSKLDLTLLRTLITKRPTAYQEELAPALGVCRQTVGRGLKKLKFTRKKNGYVFREEREL